MAVLQVLVFFCTSRSHQLGASMASCPPCAAFSPPAQKKREQLLLTSQPLLCHPPSFPLLPQEGEHHTLSANQSSAPPSPSHHLSFQGNRAPRSPSLYRSPSLFPLCFHTERCRIIIIIPPIRPSHRPILSWWLV